MERQRIKKEIRIEGNKDKGEGKWNRREEMKIKVRVKKWMKKEGERRWKESGKKGGKRRE